MSWQGTVNRLLSRLTGYRLVRADAGAGAPSASALGAVRPPADPDVDRLLRRPVFVLAPVRSGSTLLRLLLGSHPQLHAPHELHLRRLTVQVGNGLARKAMAELGHNRADLEHLLWDRVLHRELVRSGKAYVVEKTPGNAFAYQRLATCWPDARFIFLLRHPGSVVASWTAASSRRTPDESREQALGFMAAVDRARAALDGLTVRYEDLTADPERETRAICRYLELDWAPQMLGYDGGERFVKGLGDWRDKIRSGAVQEAGPLPAAEGLHPDVRAMAARWGYLGEAR